MTDSIYNNAGIPSEQKGIQMSDGIDDGGRGESWSRDGKGDLVNDSTGEPFLPSVAEQGAAPEIPEDLRKDHAQILRMRAKGVTLPWFGNDKQIELIGRIAALTLERDTLKARVEQQSAPVSDAENFHFEDDEVLGAVNGSDYISWRVRNMLSGHTSGEKWSLYRAIVKLAFAARASTPPIPLVFTCPFDGEIWRFHTQEQLDKLWKHLEWHANREQKLEGR